jgi:hypothetical protein
MSTITILPVVAPTKPVPQQQGRRRYDAADVALLIEFAQVWMETDDDADAIVSNSIPMEEPASTIGADEIKTTYSSFLRDTATAQGATMVDPSAMSNTAAQHSSGNDNASVVSVDSSEWQEDDVKMDESSDGSPSTWIQRPGESFMDTCWEIDSFMDHVQVGLA